MLGCGYVISDCVGFRAGAVQIAKLSVFQVLAVHHMQVLKLGRSSAQAGEVGRSSAQAGEVKGFVYLSCVHVGLVPHSFLCTMGSDATSILGALVMFPHPDLNSCDGDWCCIPFSVNLRHLLTLTPFAMHAVMLPQTYTTPQTSRGVCLHSACLPLGIVFAWTDTRRAQVPSLQA